MAEQNITVLVKEIKKALKPEFDAIHSDLKDLKTDVSGLKTDVSALKTDVAGLKLDLKELKEDHKEFREEFSAFKSDTMSRFDSVIKMLETLREEYYSVLAGLKRIENDHKKMSNEDIIKEINGLKIRNKELGKKIEILEAQVKK